jgi:RNA polymerase sigma-70 factor (ECF subfamily)
VDPADVTSWSVVLGAAAGRPLARDDFARRYGPVIRGYLSARWRLPSGHAEVADATNDVFVECFKGGGALERVNPRSPGGFRAFLYGVVRNVALMAERKLARRRDAAGRSSIDPDSLAADDDSLSRVFDRAWAESVVAEARERMAERSARSAAAGRRFAALGLRFDQGQQPRRMADAMGVPVERVYEILREARAEFRSILIEVLAGYHPGCGEAEVERRCIELLASLR